MMSSASRRRFFEELKRNIVTPTTELNYDNHYQLLVAVVLSAQATDKSVNAATERLFASVNVPADMLVLGEEKLISYISKIGLFRSKARYVMALSEILQVKYDGTVPRTREELEALPGVGRKTANVMLNTAFGEATIAVDTHIFRVANRTGLAPGKNVRAVEDKLNVVVPKSYKQNAHHWLILHGRYVCKARKPMCTECTVRRWCVFPSKTL